MLPRRRLLVRPVHRLVRQVEVEGAVAVAASDQIDREVRVCTKPKQASKSDLEIAPEERRRDRGGGKGGVGRRLLRTEVGGVINVIDQLRRRVLVHPHILRAVRAGRIALEDGGCAVRHHVEARVAPVIVLGPAEVLPSRGGSRPRQRQRREGAANASAKTSCAKSTQGLAAHAQMCVKASVGWQVVRRHVAEMALAYHMSLVVRLLQLGLSQRAR